MSYVRLEITEGATRDQKRAAVSDIASSLVTRPGKRPDHIDTVIDEVAEENRGFAGKLTDEWRASFQEAAHADSTQ
jgi:4-oxalocrotonate tautomerase family enzyme